MGIFLDTLEKIRENSDFDPCLMGISYYSKKYASKQDNCYPFVLPQISDMSKLQDKTRINAIQEQYTLLYSRKENKLAYENATLLLSKCIYRDKQLLKLKREMTFVSPAARDVLREYLSLVEDNIDYGWSQISTIRQYVIDLPKPSFVINENREICETINTIVGSIFCYLAKGEIDNSQYTQAVFSDTSQLISLLPDAHFSNMMSKDICREYYVSTYHPRTGIDTCDNCGELLFKGFPYCFRCFERSAAV